MIYPQVQRMYLKRRLRTLCRPIRCIVSEWNLKAHLFLSFSSFLPIYFSPLLCSVFCGSLFLHCSRIADLYIPTVISTALLRRLHSVLRDQEREKKHVECIGYFGLIFFFQYREVFENVSTFSLPLGRVIFSSFLCI